MSRLPAAASILIKAAPLWSVHVVGSLLFMSHVVKVSLPEHRHGKVFLFDCINTAEGEAGFSLGTLNAAQCCDMKECSEDVALLSSDPF